MEPAEAIAGARIWLLSRARTILLSNFWRFWGLERFCCPTFGVFRGSVDCALQLLAFLEARTILEPKAGDFSGSDDFFAKSMTLSTPRAQNV
ncbi:hypothetical protein KKF91_05915, partial [Myxococcota bacterium]|nr:hypothetical protein [Myxococcota bacterium]